MRNENSVLSWLTAGATALTGALGAGAAFAEGLVGKPIPGAASFQPAATELASDLHWLDGFILYIIAIIVVGVTALLAFIMLRYRASQNPTPARFTHHALLEVVWTVIPILILVVIAVPSLNLLHKQVVLPETDITIKATGNQWFWSYSYPDEEIEFDAFMIGTGKASYDDAVADPEVKAQMDELGMDKTTWLLQTDTEVVVPVGKNIRMQVTGADVIHSWTIPAFGVKIDAVPGRLNETWFNVQTPGVYYGQCSELCGKDHAYMPIVVRAVSEEDYAAWLSATKSASLGAPSAVKLASAE